VFDTDLCVGQSRLTHTKKWYILFCAVVKQEVVLKGKAELTRRHRLTPEINSVSQSGKTAWIIVITTPQGDRKPPVDYEASYPVVSLDVGDLFMEYDRATMSGTTYRWMQILLGEVRRITDTDDMAHLGIVNHYLYVEENEISKGEGWSHSFIPEEFRPHLDVLRNKKIPIPAV